MDIIILLVCVSVSIAVVFLVLFIWSVKSGQYEDCHTPAMRILMEDNKSETKEKSLKGEKKDERRKD